MQIKNKEKVAIVIRSFWPYNPAIGEALLQLSESLNGNYQPIVITQVCNNFSDQLESNNRGKGVRFFTLPLWTTSASHMLLRVTDLVVFTGFTFASLIWSRPDKIYVATNPPLFTPLIVNIYCMLFNKKYLYHLQDIHPEISSIKTVKKSFINRVLRAVDISTLSNASKVITLTEQMKAYAVQRVGKEIPVELLDNPSIKACERNTQLKRIKGFIYCGNAGRLQRIPLLIKSIKRYINEGGNLPFIFVGGGIYSEDIQKLANQFANVSYLGKLSADKASDMLNQYSFGLMPIEDEVTKYAFPSKSSSYVSSGCHVIAICGKNTSVANWVLENRLGYVSEPEVDPLVALFHKLERKIVSDLVVDKDMLEALTPCYHAKRLKDMIIDI